MNLPCQILFLILVAMLPTDMEAQSEGTDQPITAGWQLGVQHTTTGWGGSLHYLVGKDHLQFLMGADMHVVKDPREFRTESFFGTQGRKYVLGKQNHFAVFNPSVGIQKEIFPIRSGNLLNVRIGGKLGPALGIVTPYYLEIFSPVSGRPQLGDRVIEAYDPARHTYPSIIGRASIFDHDFNPNLQVGFSSRLFAMIDFSNTSTSIRAVQIGLNADWFASAVPIMADFAVSHDRQLFLSVQIGLLLGNRW